MQIFQLQGTPLKLFAHNLVFDENNWTRCCEQTLLMVDPVGSRSVVFQKPKFILQISLYSCLNISKNYRYKSLNKVLFHFL